jgi:hypothetical protein
VQRALVLTAAMRRGMKHLAELLQQQQHLL